MTARPPRRRCTARGRALSAVVRSARGSRTFRRVPGESRSFALPQFGSAGRKVLTALFLPRLGNRDARPLEGVTEQASPEALHVRGCLAGCNLEREWLRVCAKLYVACITRRAASADAVPGAGVKEPYGAAPYAGICRSRITASRRNGRRRTFSRTTDRFAWAGNPRPRTSRRHNSPPVAASATPSNQGRCRRTDRRSSASPQPFGCRTWGR